jgi:tRNA pseudouridine55 synthase
MHTDGLLLVDKPKGWTSFDVVAKVRGLLRAYQKEQGLPGKIKVGHTGTLDPLATGLLVLAIGAYTKKVPELTKQDKTYQTDILLGATSTTDDDEGEKVFVSDQQPSLQEVQKALDSFVGDQMQMPPKFSAIKVGGVRAYDAARKGRDIELSARPVHIYSISEVIYEYPKLSLKVSVGSGTYIRSLARDVGEALGVGGYVKELRRTEVGTYSLAQAVQMDGLTIDKLLLALMTL